MYININLYDQLFMTINFAKRLRSFFKTYMEVIYLCGQRMCFFFLSVFNEIPSSSLKKKKLIYDEYSIYHLLRLYFLLFLVGGGNLNLTIFVFRKF